MKSIIRQRDCISLLVTLVFISCCLVSPVWAEIIFQEDFDSQVDWQPRPATNDNVNTATASCSSGDCTGQVPSGWSFYRSAGWWWGSTYEDTIRINSDNYRGASGKGYTQFNESNSGDGGDGWGADGILSKYFNKDYSELHAQLWIKFKPGFQFAGGDEDILKLFRITHYDGVGGFYKFFKTGNHAPLYQFYVKQTASYGWRHVHGFRCDPQATYYYCPDDTGDDGKFGGLFTDSGNYGDGNWHRIDIQVKMNSYAGGGVWNSDGVLRYWHDGTLKEEVTNKRWIFSGTDSTIGWNTVSIGGNAYNTYTAATNYGEQWYAIDDLTVSTTSMVVFPPGVLKIKK